MSHPNLVHVDDLPELAIAGPQLGGRRVKVGPAAGARRCGLSLYRLGPGERAMPVHVHADEEEHFYVLSGSGLSWQDGRTWHVTAGDYLLHPPQGAAHTIVAGEQGMEVLAFGTGSDTHMTWLPRAGAWWMGPHWIPADGPNPFDAERAAGALDLGAVQDGPPPHSASVRRTTPYAQQRPGYREVHHRLADAAGAVGAGLHHAVIAPRQFSAPQHWHSAEEEIFVILDGKGEAHLDDDVIAVRPGHVLWCPPDTGVAHALRAGDVPMTYLVFGTRVPGDFCVYPRSGKVNFGKGLIFRPEPLDYWDGEERDEAGDPLG